MTMNEAPTADGGPGFLAFLAFFILALALWFLMRNMNARMRRMSYRQQAAHRGKDDPQVAPGELGTEPDGPDDPQVAPGELGTEPDGPGGPGGPVAGTTDAPEGGTASGPVDGAGAAGAADDGDGTTGTDEKGPREGQ
jgi:hypothetical protein